MNNDKNNNDDLAQYLTVIKKPLLKKAKERMTNKIYPNKCFSTGSFVDNKENYTI